MDSAANESEYLPSHESEDSFDEDDYEEEDERPNRWRGPKSSWQQLNSLEINTLTALDEIRDRDLSVHLYNAFALKRRYKRVKNGATPDGPVAEKDINAVTGKPVEPDDWLPQRSWTAWPMRVDKVPPPNDPARLGLYDPDERFTFRKPTRDMPSAVLEEVLSAGILKSAKEKFNARPWVQSSASDEEAITDPENRADDEVSDGVTVKSPLSTKSKKSNKSRSRSQSRPKSVKSELISEDERMGDVDEQDQPQDGSSDEQSKKRRFKPITSTDDDLSYSLLRPSVRHILTQLDTTLTILHNAQEATLRYQSDSGDSESQSDASMLNLSPRTKRGQKNSTTKNKKAIGSDSRRQSTSQAPGDTGEKQGKKLRKAGRPKKEYPRLEGETDRQYEIRVARIHKKPIPALRNVEQEPGSAAESEPGRESGNSGDGEETEGPSSRGKVKKRKRVVSATTTTATAVAATRDRPRRSPSAASSASTTSRRGATRTRNRAGLRDWKDILGAAALAGFPAPAIDRAARRCADLFNGTMTLQTLLEGPAPASRHNKLPPARVTTYVPGMPQPPILDSEDEEPDYQLSAQPTRTPSMGASDSASTPGPSSSRSISRPGIARNRSGTPGSYQCSIRDCPRAKDGEGFARRPNLVRHLKLVHGVVSASTSASSEGLGGGGGSSRDDSQSVGTSTSAMTMVTMPEEEVDSEDEMFGAVHVDWYLRPVKLQQGWRGADAEEAKGKRRRAGVGRGRGRPRSKARGGGVGERSDIGGADDDGDVRMGEDD